MIQKLKIFGIFLLFSSGLQASISLTVTNIRQVQGNLMVGIYSNQEDLEKRNGCRDCKGYNQKIWANVVNMEIKDLTPGWYMIAVYHDINSNAKLDTNFVGIPSEPYGFSLNQMGIFGPSFEKSRFYYDGKTLNLEIKLK